jgi:hypothetical protein
MFTCFIKKIEIFTECSSQLFLNFLRILTPIEVRAVKLDSLGTLFQMVYFFQPRFSFERMLWKST